MFGKNLSLTTKLPSIYWKIKKFYYYASEVDRPEWSGTRPEVKTSVTAMDTVMTWWL